MSASKICQLVTTMQGLKNRLCLQRTTTTYFQSLPPDALAAERHLEAALFESAAAVNFQELSEQSLPHSDL